MNLNLPMDFQTYCENGKKAQQMPFTVSVRKFFGLFPATDITVVADQIEHKTKAFGVNLGGVGNYPAVDGYAGRVFNEFTIPVPWQKDGDAGYQQYVDHMLNSAGGRPTTLHGVMHCHKDYAWPGFFALDAAQQTKALTDRYSMLRERFGGRVNRWVVLTEVGLANTPAFFRTADLFTAPIAAAHTVTTNEVGDLFGAHGYAYHTDGAQEIGVQCHMTSPPDLNIMAEAFDRLAETGKLINITEVSAEIDDEDTEADWAAKVYRLAMAHPAVRSITWWSLLGDEWKPGIGLFRQDGRAKLVAPVLQGLILSEFHTRATGRTNSKGQYRFYGWPGRYRVTAGGRTTTVDLVSCGQVVTVKI